MYFGESRLEYDVYPPGGGWSGEGDGRMQRDWVRRVRDFARDMVPEERRRRPEAAEAVPDVFPEELLGENPNPLPRQSCRAGKRKKKQQVRRQMTGVMPAGISAGKLLRLIMCAAGVTALVLASVHLDRFRTACRVGYSSLLEDAITRKLDSCLAEGDFVGVAILGERYDIADSRDKDFAPYQGVLKAAARYTEVCEWLFTDGVGNGKNEKMWDGECAEREEAVERLEMRELRRAIVRFRRVQQQFGEESWMQEMTSQMEELLAKRGVKFGSGADTPLSN